MSTPSNSPMMEQTFVPRHLDNVPRPELTPMPDRIARLPVRRGYPVPWFVGMVNGEPEFRLADPEKWVLAIENKLCWVCGDTLGKFHTFVAGPMCGINRTSTEPPCHHSCATWSVCNCPFLSKPQMVRRENDLPADTREAAGMSIRRNPGVSLLWTVTRYSLFSDGKGGVLLEMGEPSQWSWWFMGKPASRAQVDASIAGGLPALAEAAATERGAMKSLAQAIERFERYLPKE